MKCNEIKYDEAWRFEENDENGRNMYVQPKFVPYFQESQFPNAQQILEIGWWASDNEWNRETAKCSTYAFDAWRVSLQCVLCSLLLSVEAEAAASTSVSLKGTSSTVNFSMWNILLLWCDDDMIGTNARRQKATGPTKRTQKNNNKKQNKMSEEYFDSKREREWKICVCQKRNIYLGFLVWRRDDEKIAQTNNHSCVWRCVKNFQHEKQFILFILVFFFRLLLLLFLVHFLLHHCHRHRHSHCACPCARCCFFWKCGVLCMWYLL